MRYLRILSLTLVLVMMILPLGGCGSQQSFRYDLDGPVSSLDPQFTQEEEAWLILANTMEGLVRRMPDGQLEPGLAERYTISEDGCTYTFYLREGLQWSAYENQEGEEVTLSLTGVYCRVGISARFKPVEAIYAGEDYYLVTPTPNAMGSLSETWQEIRTLRMGDEVIVTAKDLYDGKVLG